MWALVKRCLRRDIKPGEYFSHNESLVGTFNGFGMFLATDPTHRCAKVDWSGVPSLTSYTTGLDAVCYVWKYGSELPEGWETWEEDEHEIQK